MYPLDIQEFINLCSWDSVRFLFVSGNVFDPFIYYSHLLPIVLSLGLGFFILLKNQNSLHAKVLFAITAGFSTWSFFDLIIWATDKPHYTMALWSVINLIEILIYAAVFYFLQIFITQKDSSLKSKILVLVPSLPIILLTPTSLSLSAYDLTNCVRDAVEGPLSNYVYLAEILYIAAIVIYAMESWKKNKRSQDRKRIALISIGALLFLLTFSWGNIVGSLSDDWRLAQWGALGMPVMIFFLGYLIVKFKEFNLKIFASQALVWALWIMIGAILFVAQTDATRIVTAVTELIAIVFGIMLIKSVRREVEQREQLAALNIELAETNVKLSEVNRQKTELVSFANHDLQSPINKVKQFASLVLDGTYKEPSKIMDAIGKIKFQAEEATKMIISFLDLRKIEEGQMPFNPEVKNIVSFVRDIVAEEKPSAERRGIALAFKEGGAQEIRASIDTTQMRQVIENLISNALKYTEPTAPGAKQNWVTVSVTEEQKSVLITIKDSGLGMDKALLPVLFEQFRRDPGVAKKIQGTGLGLFITKKFVLAHHGEIWAESEGKGFGSTFCVRIPKA